MKTLLVPTDFSKVAKNAFDYALKLAELINAQIKVVNVQQESTSHAFEHPAALMEQTIVAGSPVKNDLRRFVTFEKQLDTPIAPKIETDFYECLEPVDNKIIGLSKSSMFDILVMGTKGDGNSDKTFGSTSSYVAQKACCPVLLVPEDLHYRNPRKILFAHSLDEPTDLEVMQRLNFIAQCLDSTIFNLFVDTCKGIHEEMSQFTNLEWNIVESERFDFKTEIVKNTSVIDTIQNYVTDNNIDLVVFSTHNQSLLKDVFIETNDKKKVQPLNFPMLVLHSKDKFSYF